MQISSITKRPYTCVRSAYSFSRVFNENIVKVCGKFEQWNSNMLKSVELKHLKC